MPVRLNRLYALLSIIVVMALSVRLMAQAKLSPEAAAVDYGRLPLSFEANVGQEDSKIRFSARGDGYGIYLTDEGAVLTLHRGKGDADVVRMQVLGGGNGHPPEGADPLPGTSNYFLGSDPAKWHAGIPTFGRVSYSRVYPGINLVYYGNQRQLEYDFVVAPGASVAPIRLQFVGADGLRLTPQGDLTIKARDGEIAFKRPVVYQRIGGRRSEVDGGFTLLTDKTVGFSVGAYDHSQPLVIDPTLSYSTYLGGTASDYLMGIAVDSTGAAFVTGYTTSANFPVTVGAFEGSDKSSTAAFVSKLNAAGTALLYSTYLGGISAGDLDYGISVAIDASGDAYVTGHTRSSDFPTTSGAFQKTNNAESYNQQDTGFVTKLNATGTALVYSTFLGGTSLTEPSQVAVDAAGNAYVTGITFSTDFPTTAGAYQTSNRSAAHTSWNGFVSKINPSGSALVYSTYLGGSGETATPGSGTPVNFNFALAVDAGGDAYVEGYSTSVDFPVTGGVLQGVNKGYTAGSSAPVNPNVTLTELNPAGTALVYSTYLGGSGATYSGGVAVDSNGDAYPTGYTYATNFPVTSGVVQATNKGQTNGSSNLFVAKVNPGGTALLYATYLGGSGEYNAIGDVGDGIAIDSIGDAFVTGYSFSANYPITSNGYQTTNLGAQAANANAIISELSPSGASLLYSSFLGGSGQNSGAGDRAQGVALDPSGNAYVGGYTNSLNFPVTPSAYEGSLSANSRVTGFVTKFPLAPTVAAVTPTISPSGGSYVSAQTVTLADATAGATIYYSTNGTTPTMSSTMYTAPFTVSSTETVEALAIAPTYLPSAVATASYTIGAPAATPVISLAGGTYTSAQTVTITDATPGATIYYTTNGTMPTTGSAVYSGPITVSSSETLMAIAVANGYLTSSVASAAYTINIPTAPVVTLSPSSSSLVYGAGGGTVTLTASANPLEPLADGYTWTLYDGTTALVSGAASNTANGYTFTTGLLTAGTHSFKVVYASANTMQYPTGTSNVVTVTVSQATPVLTWATPAAVTVGTTLSSTQLNATAASVSGSSLAGSFSYNPAAGTVLNNAGPVTLNTTFTPTDSTDYTTATASVTLTVNPVSTPVAATPVISPAGGSYTSAQTVTIMDATTGATIYYTTNGTTPTTASIQYTGTITVSSSETIEAIAVAAGYTNSDVATASYIVSSSTGTQTQNNIPVGQILTVGSGLKQPTFTGLDASGNLYVYDNSTQDIVKIAPNGSQTTVATVGQSCGVESLAVDGGGDVFISVLNCSFGGGGGTIYKYDPNGVRSTITYAGQSGSNSCTSVNGLTPITVGADMAGDIYVFDLCLGLIELSGSGQSTVISLAALGFGGESAIHQHGFAIDASGNIYLSDSWFGVIYKISGGSATEVVNGLVEPTSLAVDGAGNLYYPAGDYGALRKLSPSGTTTVMLYAAYPQSLSVDDSGNLYFTAENLVYEIRYVGQSGANSFGSLPLGSSTAATQFTFVFGAPVTLGASSIQVVTQGAAALDFMNAGSGSCSAQTYATGSTCSVDVRFTPTAAGIRQGAVVLTDANGDELSTTYLQGTGLAPVVAFSPATQSTVATGGSNSSLSFGPLAIDSAGNVYVVQGGSSVVQIAPGGTQKTVFNTSVVAGNTAINGIAVDGAGYLCLTMSNATSSYIGKVAPGGSFTLFAYPPTIGAFNPSGGIAADSLGDIFVTDSKLGIVELTPAGVASVAVGPTGFNSVSGVAVDGTGNLYIVDAGNSRIVKVAPNGTQTTVGSGFTYPDSVAVDGSGTVYVVNNTSDVYRITPDGVQSEIFTGGINGDPKNALAVDGAGNVFTNYIGTIYRISQSTPAALSFASTNVGSTSADSPQTIIVSNIGNAPLSFPAPGSGTNANLSANFLLGNSTSCPQVGSNANAGTLASGTSCTYAVSFQPQTTGPITGLLTLTDNTLGATGPYATQTIPLNGMGTGTVATVTLGNLSQTYTGSPLSVSASTNPSGLSVNITYNGSTTAPTAAGSYSVVATITQAGYSGAATGTLVIAKATPTVMWATPAAIGYGTALSGTQLDATASVGGVFTYSPMMGTVLTTGSHTLSVTFVPTDTTDFNTVTASVTLVVSNSTPTLTWTPPAAITYGTALSSTQLDATASVAGSFVYAPPSGTVLAAGQETLNVNFTPNDTTDYASATGSTTLTVKQAPLTVTAASVSRKYGAANPTLTATLSGVVNNDSLTATASTSATTASVVGTYSIVPVVSGAALTNYSVTPVNGTLTVTQAGSITGLNVSPATVNAGANLTLTASVTSATTGTPTGTVQFLNGTTVIGSGTLTAGVASFSTSTLAAGSYNVTASYTGDSNFTASSSTTAAITVVPVVTPDFSITSSMASLTIKQGATGTATLTLTPAGGFNQAITFACSGLPSEASCSFAPASVTPNGAAVNTVLTIATTAPTAMLKGGGVPWNPQSKGIVALAMLFGLLAGWRRRRSVPRLCLLIAIGLAILLPAGGCGSGTSSTTTQSNPGTPVGTDQVAVTASSSGAVTTQHTVAVSVTIAQ